MNNKNIKENVGNTIGNMITEGYPVITQQIVSELMKVNIKSVKRHWKLYKETVIVYNKSFYKMRKSTNVPLQGTLELEPLTSDEKVQDEEMLIRIKAIKGIITPENFRIELMKTKVFDIISLDRVKDRWDELWKPEITKCALRNRIQIKF